jgi:hypothetical protein
MSRHKHLVVSIALLMLAGTCSCLVSCHRSILGMQGRLGDVKPSDTVSADLDVKTVVYRDLIGQPSEARSKAFGAYSLEADANEEGPLLAVFTDWSPRVETSTNNVIITETNVIDRLSGKPAVLYWTRLSGRTNGTVSAVGGRYYGPRSGVEFNYDLRYNRTNWSILQKKRSAIW